MASSNLRETAWKWLQDHPNSSARDISTATGINITHCRDSLNTWLKKGWVIQKKTKGKTRYPKRFSVDESAEPVWGQRGRIGSKIRYRHQKTKRQKLWNNMKIGRKFTVSDLVSSIDVEESTARNYLIYLNKSGFVVERSRKPEKKRLSPSQGKEIEWLLIRDTGRLAPIVRREGCWDQNEQKLYPFQVPLKERQKQHCSSKEDMTNDMA
ncbi:MULTISPECIES: hypothetical protein [Vibrionaceae]|uniref:Sugar-specific transcriptional regulator TrmB n=2 Tax=Vibrionaceae TaxID=641 RepID=A0A128FKK6_9GAMM|nr:hypothetical protein [Grimontia marina]CZF86756.1 Sugar-specific transcriptional regulator TrmB [Grimontia marina]